MSETEIRSRVEILFENYAKLINIEAQTMIEMVVRDILPAVNAYTADVARGAAAKLAVVPMADVSMENDLVETLSRLVGEAFATVKELKDADACAMAGATSEEKATVFAGRVIPVMEVLRRKIDAMEELTAGDYWPMPNYGDMMFRI
jgi:glutamine synthetase